MDITIQTRIKQLEHERDLLRKVIDSIDDGHHSAIPQSRCSCGDPAYYWSHYDDDKVKCTKCHGSTCVKCIGNHCNYCDNYYNITCRSCLGESILCEECNTLSCHDCRDSLSCEICYKIYDLKTCPGCFIYKSNLVSKCKCGKIMCIGCVVDNASCIECDLA